MITSLKIKNPRPRLAKRGGQKSKLGLPRRIAPPTRGWKPREEVRYLWGFSIVEMLVVTMIFSILAILATQSIFLTLRGSRKSESLVSVRENVDYAFAIMERQIRNAQSVDCTNSDDITLLYTDEHGASSSFSCLGGSAGYIASGSATSRLTNPEVSVNCSGIFSCTPASGGVPAWVSISITAGAAESFGAEGAEVTTSTRILLRSY